MVYPKLLSAYQNKTAQLAVLLDPDSELNDSLIDFISDCIKNGVDYFFVGGSLTTEDHLEEIILFIKANCTIPVVLFPGSLQQLNQHADAVLFLSVLSSRNAEHIIGQQVIAAPHVKKLGLEPIGTAYLVVDGGKATTVSYITNSAPIPNNKPRIAAATAMAADIMGFPIVYLDAGSGAQQNVSPAIIQAVSVSIQKPLVVGGGITSAQQAELAWQSGATVVVVGNVLEENPKLIESFCQTKQAMNNIKL